jgi:hypothetical protein
MLGGGFGLVPLASNLTRSSALTALIWSVMAFFWSFRRSYSARNSESVIPAKEGSCAFRRAPRVSERIDATSLGPMPGKLSQ